MFEDILNKIRFTQELKNKVLVITHDALCYVLLYGILYAILYIILYVIL